MQSRSVYKVPHGKLLKITVEYDEKKNRIKKLQIHGDFFAHPEEAVESLEHELQNTIFERHPILEKIRSAIEQNHIEFTGVDPEGLTEGIMD
jgi:hypothetical protein